MSPIFIDPNQAPPPPPETITSPDGLLTLHRMDYGIVLIADYSTPGTPAKPAVPEKVIARNLYPDPSHEYGIAPWGASPTAGAGSITVDSAQRHSGTQSIKVSTTSDGQINRNYNAGTAASLGLAVGDKVTFAAWVYIPTGPAPTVLLRIGGTALTGVNSNIPTDRDRWVMIEATGTITNASGSVTPFIYGVPFAGGAVWYDDFGLSVGGTAVTFNGDSPGVETIKYRWVATPGSSISEQYNPAIPEKPATPSTWPEDIHQVQFVRVDRHGNRTPVRSGDPAWSIGGQAVALDAEAPLDATSTWMAIPIMRDRSKGKATERASLLVPDLPYGPINCWAKSIIRPDLSMPLIATEPLPELSREERQNLTAVQGSPYPSGAWDVHAAWTSSFAFLTENANDQAKIEQLFTHGVVLLQFATRLNLPTMYALPGSLSMTPQARVDTGAHAWTVPITQVARPATYGSLMHVPGRTLAETQQGSIAARQAVFPRVGDTLGVPL